MFQLSLNFLPVFLSVFTIILEDYINSKGYFFGKFLGNVEQLREGLDLVISKIDELNLGAVGSFLGNNSGPVKAVIFRVLAAKDSTRTPLGRQG